MTKILILGAGFFGTPGGRIFLGIGLFLLTILIYFPGLGANLVADDFRLVGRLDFENAFGSLRDTVGFGRNEYRPLIAFSFALSNMVWDKNPLGYHLESIALHGANVVLLFVWLLLLTKSSSLSAMAGVLFAVHPVHHARVVWIAARDSLLSTLFVLAALIVYTVMRRRMGPGVVRSRRTLVLLALALALFIPALLSYEGAVIFPGLVAGLEFLVFADPKWDARQKLRAAAARAFPFAAILLVYLAWWVLLFQGKVGEYALSFSPGNIFGNYYSLFYQLFYGNQHLAGVLYFMLIFLALLTPRSRVPLIAYSVLWILLSFLPFSVIDGFAGRFAYAGAAGYALMIAILLSACTLQKGSESAPALRYVPLQASAAIFLILAVYYSVDLRGKIAEWRTAGEIADSISTAVKVRYPELPDGATLVLSGIPRMFGHAYVYPLGLDAAIERHYPGRRLQVFFGPGSAEETRTGVPAKQQNTFYFQYRKDQGGLEEVTEMQK